ncbi:MAG: efflux RND transporter periplasmic adaptor subunit [Gemmatimonadota bacterium]
MKNRNDLHRAAAVWIALLVIGCGDSQEVEELAVEAVEEHAEGVLLDSTAIALAGIQVGPAEARETSGLPVTGTITFDANLVSHVGSRTEGRIVRLDANIGQHVSAGDVLAVLESPEIGQLRAEDREAEELAAIASENYARKQRLAEQGISSRREVLESEAELRRAEAAVRSVEERLRVLGASDGVGGEFAITAPFVGTVVARDASLGEMAAPENELFTVADLARLWIELDVFERDLSRVAVGQSVEVTTAAFPDRVFPGRIGYLGAILDPVTRTIDARVELPNPDAALRPGMFAHAVIQIPGGGGPTVVVPAEAIQDIEGQPSVFVPTEVPGEFRPTPVDVGQTVANGLVEIRAGLEPGALIVLTGAFALRSELAAGEIAEDGH